jgi:hypothetical protein
VPGSSPSILDSLLRNHVFDTSRSTSSLNTSPRPRPVRAPDPPGPKNSKFVAICLPPPPDDDLPDGVGAKFVLGDSLKDDEVSCVYRDFLPRALAAGTYVAALASSILGKGLDAVQAASETQKKGVSAKKLVVSLQV